MNEGPRHVEVAFGKTVISKFLLGVLLSRRERCTRW